MKDIEHELIARENLNSDDKYYSEAPKLYLNLVWLNGEVGTGAADVAGGANYRPTDAETAILANFEKQLAAAEGDYSNLMKNALPAFNRTAAKNRLQPVFGKRGALAPLGHML